MQRIAFFDTKPYDREVFDRANESFGFDIEYFEAGLNVRTANLSKGFDAVCAFVNDAISEPVVKILVDNEIKALALRCAGYNNVCLKAAKDKIPVVNVPHYSPYAVAEHAVALMLTLNRKIHIAHQRTRDNNFSINGLLGFDMHGKSVGIIGLGAIGKIVAHILKGFGMHVLFYDKYPDIQFASTYGCRSVDLDTLYKQSDIITLHCPLIPQNVHLLNKDAFDKMKDGVMIINTSRGGLINAHDLVNGLKMKKVGFAGLDVYEEESSVFFEDLSGTFIPDDVLARLQTFPNVLITSHQAFFTREALDNISRTTLENLREVFLGKPLTNEVKLTTRS
jgi:D-lactate dehydrogenase